MVGGGCDVSGDVSGDTGTVVPELTACRHFEMLESIEKKILTNTKSPFKDESD